MTDLLGIYGAGGCGRGIMPLARVDPAFHDRTLVFIDDGAAGETVNGHAVWSFERFAAEPARSRQVCLAIADPHLRGRIDRACRDADIEVVGTRAANVVVMDDVVIGPGALLSPFVTLTSNIRIGRAFHANINAYVEHDCRIGDFVTFAPGVQCNGHVHIGDHAYVGAGALIRQGRPGNPLTIGAGAVIGMGAVVTRDVPAGETVVGNPARRLPRDA